MHNNKAILADTTLYKNNFLKRNFAFDEELFLSLEQDKKDKQSKAETLQSTRNSLSKSIGQLRASANKNETPSQEITDIEQQVKDINSELESIKAELQIAQTKLYDFTAQLPNLLDKSVPDGKTEADNKIIFESSIKPKDFDFDIKDHVVLGKDLGCLDFVTAANLSGSRFSLLSADIAKLHRALVYFMLNEHTSRGYVETQIPYLVHKHCLFGTGQLPKFAEDLYFTVDEEFALIPTAEVALTNIVRQSILKNDDLPKKYTAVSSCFRKEAGSYGKDTQGLFRQHQFEKVELVQIVRQGDGEQALEEISQDAQNILKLLKLPYRVVALCAGDTGFSARKTLDIEVWLPSSKSYREISSCSWCGDFQGRRMNARYKDDQKKNQFVETLNGSGLAVGRTLLAVLENYQQEDGSVVIPEVLRGFFAGAEKLNNHKG